MISIGSNIIIKNIAGADKLSLGISESFVHAKELMKQNEIRIQFKLNIIFDFVRGDYIEYNDEHFILRKNYQPEEISSGEYNYEMIFYGVDMQFQDIVLFYTMQELKEAEWVLTSSARDFMSIVLENIRRYFNDDAFILGDILQSEIQTVSFDGDTVFDGLNTIAEAFNAEWYLQGKALNLVQKYQFGSPIILEREVAVANIERSNENNEEFCTRLYALGSTRNIPRNYRAPESGEAVDAIVQRRLRLPASNGNYIDITPNMRQNEILERVVRFDHIYPRRIGTITELRSDNRTEDTNNPFIVYFFKDSGLNFNSSYILPGETLMITFESGWLQGRDFELAYDDKSGEFEIINNTDNPDLTIPNESLRPRTGDQYVIYNFDISLVSDQYIPEAEQELLTEATAWLKSITEDNATYTCPNVPGYCYQNGIDLEIGQHVKLVSPIFMAGNKESRIYGFTKSLFNKYICTYLVGDVPEYSRLNNMDKTAQETKTLADIQYRETSRRIRALNYLRTAMENETVIDKGLILTTLLRLGARAANQWKEAAGTSGIYQDEDDIAFWAGGTLDQAISLVENPDQTEDVAAYAVTMGGKLIANKAIIRGIITALGGKIGGFGIIGDMLTNEGFDNDASIIFRNDIKNMFAGIGGDIVPGTAGFEAVARFENNDNTGASPANHNVAIVVEASGAAQNTAILMAGGWISGFALKVRRIEVSQNLTHSDVYISCYNASGIIELTLPAEPEPGKMYYIRQMNTFGVKIIAKLTDDAPAQITPGYYIHTNGNKYLNITSSSPGRLNMLFFDGQNWCLNISNPS